MENNCSWRDKCYRTCNFSSSTYLSRSNRGWFAAWKVMDEINGSSGDSNQCCELLLRTKSKIICNTFRKAVNIFLASDALNSFTKPVAFSSLPCMSSKLRVSNSVVEPFLPLRFLPICSRASKLSSIRGADFRVLFLCA